MEINICVILKTFGHDCTTVVFSARDNFDLIPKMNFYFFLLVHEHCGAVFMENSTCIIKDTDDGEIKTNV